MKVQVSIGVLPASERVPRHSAKQNRIKGICRLYAEDHTVPLLGSIIDTEREQGLDMETKVCIAEQMICEIEQYGRITNVE